MSTSQAKQLVMKSSRRRKLRKYVVESLEQRRLLASLVEGGELFVSTNDDDNVIDIWIDEEDFLNVEVDGNTVSYPSAGIEHIRVSANGGSDQITIQDSVTQATTLDGGTGDDGIRGGLRADRILGGAGNDKIDGSAGNDVLVGGSGKDSINAGPGNDWVFGDAANSDSGEHADPWDLSILPAPVAAKTGSPERMETTSSLRETHRTKWRGATATT